jgi:hypothetical protein
MPDFHSQSTGRNTRYDDSSAGQKVSVFVDFRGIEPLNRRRESMYPDADLSGTTRDL